jgi:hypothetical protein
MLRITQALFDERLTCACLVAGQQGGTLFCVVHAYKVAKPAAAAAASAAHSSVVSNNSTTNNSHAASFNIQGYLADVCCGRQQRYFHELGTAYSAQHLHAQHQSNMTTFNNKVLCMSALMQAKGCDVDLDALGKAYHLKKRLCEAHMRVSGVICVECSVESVMSVEVSDGLCCFEQDMREGQGYATFARANAICCSCTHRLLHSSLPRYTACCGTHICIVSVSEQQQSVTAN